MINIICTLIKYINIFLIVFYTYECFSIFSYSDLDLKETILKRQTAIVFIFQLLCFLTMYLIQGDVYYLCLYAALAVLTIATIAFYVRIYPKVSRLILNNMCMLISFGIIMITRLEFNLGVKQFIVFAFSMVISLFVPVIIRKAKFLSNHRWVNAYAVIGILALVGVAVLAETSYGAKLGFTVFGVSLQPSEFVKIIFVFYIAGSLYSSTSFRNVVITTIIAAIHVLTLAISTDLGAAVILFMVYLVMIYVGTKKKRYALAGILAGIVGCVLGYYLFSHVQVRVEAWVDPFAVYSGSGYQVAQSLFAIGTGGWLGLGLLQGAPTTIPVAESDFIFSAICEEMGLIVGLCVILMCVSCYIMFLNVAMQIENQFYKLIALGLGTTYIFQAFLTIGGVTKFIPSTGVTLPLVSYGGSSLLSTLIIFAIIQGLYILREDEEEDIERIRENNLRRERTAEAKASSKGQARSKTRSQEYGQTRVQSSNQTRSQDSKQASKQGSKQASRQGSKQVSRQGSAQGDVQARSGSSKNTNKASITKGRKAETSKK